MYWLVI